MDILEKSTYIQGRLFTEKIIFRKAQPFCLFIHGGPGLNAYSTSKFIQKSSAYAVSSYNFIFYDQAGCGRSRKNVDSRYLHIENIKDLKDVLDYYSWDNIQIIIGHSYGAKLLYDYLEKYGEDKNMEYIFLSTSENILIPRLNNLLLDLKYLKKAKPELYKESLAMLENCYSSDAINAITDQLNPYFLENPYRLDYYWANNEAQQEYISIKNPYSLSQDVFEKVRKDLYSDPANYNLDIDRIKKSRWVVGFHDFIMEGNKPDGLKKEKIVFFRSGHYPHIEEPDKFLELLNEGNQFFIDYNNQ